MGIGNEICVFFRQPCYGDSERTRRPGSGEKEIGFEIPDFPKTRAPALRFGSMNPISRVFGRGSTGRAAKTPNPPWVLTSLGGYSVRVQK